MVRSLESASALVLVSAMAFVLSACSTSPPQAAPTAAPAVTASPGVSNPAAPASLPSAEVSPAASPSSSPSASGSIQTLLGVRQIPPYGTGSNPGPAPAASPGASPAASPSVAAAAAPSIPESVTQPLGPFGLYMEVIAAAQPSQYGFIASPGCVEDSLYKRGMELVFRFTLTDLANDRYLTPDDNPTVSIQIPNAPALRPRFEPIGPPGAVDPDAPWSWVATWSIPPDYPLGTVKYTVQVATTDGRSATLTPISLDTYPTIVE